MIAFLLLPYVLSYEIRPGWVGGNITLDGRLNNIGFFDDTPSKWNQVRGSVNDIAFVPGTNGKEAYACATNLGLQHTTNYDADMPSWTRVPGLPSSMSAVATSEKYPNLVAIASGKVSSYMKLNSFPAGVMLSLDGGNSWNSLDVNKIDYANSNFVRVEIFTNAGLLAVAACGSISNGSGLFISTNSEPLQLLVEGKCTSIYVDDADDGIVFVAFFDKIVRTTDGFITYDVLDIPSDRIPVEARLTDNSWGRQGIALQKTDIDLLIVFITSNYGPGYFVFTPNPYEPASTFWDKASLTCGFYNPESTRPPAVFGQANIHLGFVVHPTDPYTVYIAGSYYYDNDKYFSGNLVKGDVRFTVGYTAKLSSNPYGTFHPDIRRMVWTPSGRLAIVCDGGIFEASDLDTLYDFPEPTYRPVSGFSPNFEAHTGSYDPVTGVTGICVQDSGCVWSGNSTSAVGDLFGDGGGCALLRAAPEEPAFLFSSAQLLQGLHGVYPLDPTDLTAGWDFDTMYSFHDVPPPSRAGFVTFWKRAPNHVVAMGIGTDSIFALIPTLDNYYLFYSKNTGFNLGDQQGLVYDGERYYFTDGYTMYTGVLPSAKADYNNTEVFDFVEIWDHGNLAKDMPFIYSFSIDPLNPDRFFVDLNAFITDAGREVEKVECPRYSNHGCITIWTSLWIQLDESSTALLVGTNIGIYVTFPEKYNDGSQMHWAMLRYGVISDQIVMTMEMVEGTLFFTTFGSAFHFLDNAVDALIALRDLHIVTVPFRRSAAFDGLDIRRQGAAAPVIVEFSETITVVRREFFLIMTETGELMNISEYFSQPTGDSIAFDLSSMTSSGALADSDVFVILCAVGDIVSAADNTVYLGFSTSLTRKVPRPIQYGDDQIALYFGAISNGIGGDDPSAVATNLQIEATEIPNELLLTWTPGAQSSCDFSFWLVSLFADGSPVYGFYTTTNLFSYQAYEGVLVRNLGAKISYTFSVHESCLSASDDPPESALSASGLAKSPPSGGASLFVDKKVPVTASTISFNWKPSSRSTRCVHEDWELQIALVDDGTWFSPGGCGTDVLAVNQQSCTATGLNATTNYHYARIRETCTDPTLNSEWRTQETSWDTGVPFPTTLAADCNGLCDADKCVDGFCDTSCAVSDCCFSMTGENACADTDISECVCGFDPWCCAVGWDTQCIDEAKKDCGMAC
jgi:hypothetical protein